VVGDTSVRFCGLALHYKVIPGYLSLGLLGAPTPLFSMKKEGWGREFNKLGRSESKLTFYTALRAKCYWHSVKVSKEIYKTSRSSFSFFFKKKTNRARGFANDYYRELLTSFYFFFFHFFPSGKKKKKEKRSHSHLKRGI
jgi:hypothetical protein